MRVLIVNNLFGKRARGGAERIVEIEAEALAAAGHEVLVVSGAPSGDAAPTGGVCLPDGPCELGNAGDGASAKYRHMEVTPPNFYFYGEGSGRSFAVRLAWLLRDLFNFAAARQLAAVLDEFKPDVVHTHNLIGLGMQLPRLLRRRGLRHVHTAHDVQLVDSTGQIMLSPAPSTALRAARWLHAKLFGAVFGSPDMVLFPSAFLRKFYKSYGLFPRSRCFVVPNPAPAAATAERTRPERMTFLFVGQLEAHKGVRLLLEAWRAAGLTGATLEIVGDGALRGEVEATAAANHSIVYRGRLANEVVQAAWARVTFAVVPSLVLENSPTVIIEALAAGTPVIAMNQGGIPELVKAGETGWLVPVDGGAEAWSEALQRAASLEPSAWQTMSDSARLALRNRTTSEFTRRMVEFLWTEK
jgi:glycosyltransferase involved in cell wall biosynthesis